MSEVVVADDAIERLGAFAERRGWGSALLADSGVLATMEEALASNGG